MSITDELRKWAEDNTLRDRELTTCPPQHVVRGVLETLLRIADRIDAEHERLMGEQYKSLTIDMEPMTDEHMAEHGWVRLPVDADGVPIRVGDKVQLIGNDPSTVSHMSLADDGWRVYVKYDGGIGTGSGEPKRIRHHHAPTVEDVLREFGRGWHEQMNGPETFDVADYVERYAAKLRLAGDAE